ncbi:MAG TPA: AI-2E family transporter [Methylomirabilota bacterium]|nr:AI-2E family transporter [Methylomirabilota bacterium]
MSFPAPTERQGRILWFTLTALAIAVFLAILGLVVWGAAWVLKQLTAVLLPLAVAAILAYLLDPVVDLLERARVPRSMAIFLVFLLGVTLVVIGAATVVPQLVLETQGLINTLSSEEFRDRITKWLESSSLASKAKEAWESEFGSSVQEYLRKTAPVVSAWLWAQMGRLASWFSLLMGFALVPVYLFYFLLEKRGIQSGWTTYLPLHESKVKQEVIFVINAINDYLIVFFRGQVLVALIDGIMLTIGFLAMGLNYAFLLGIVAGLLSIVPFLGVALSLLPALILAAVQFGDWLHPMIVLGIFALVQFIEGFVVSPKIMGDRVGLHPLTIIVAVMVGTTLMGGIIGGILAIPLTAALRVVMFRYVWRAPDHQAPVLPP